MTIQLHNRCPGTVTPPNQLRDKASRYWGKSSHNGTLTIIMNRRGIWQQGSRPFNIRFRLVTAISFTTNWCTSRTLLNKIKSEKITIGPVTCRPPRKCQTSALHECYLRGLSERWFPTHDRFVNMPKPNEKVAGPTGHGREAIEVHQILHN